MSTSRAILSDELRRKRIPSNESQESHRSKVRAAALATLPKAKTKSKPPLGRLVIHILVGPSQQDFGVHKDLICHYSPYFRAAFTSGFQETQTGIMKLPETDISVFELFSNWLYFQTLWDANNEQQSWPQLSDLMKLYLFADMVNIPSLSNHTIEAIEAISKKSNVISTKSFPYVWQHTQEASPIRRLLVDMMVWTASDGVLDRLAQDCYNHESGKDIMLEIMKAMRKQMLMNENSFRQQQVSPLKHIKNYFVEEETTETL